MILTYDAGDAVNSVCLILIPFNKVLHVNCLVETWTKLGGADPAAMWSLYVVSVCLFIW